MRDARWILEKAGKAPVEPHDAASLGDVALPRSPDVFVTSQFGPGVPIVPYGVDVPEDGIIEPRLSEYLPGWNLASLPGYTKLVPFQLLRAISKTVLPVWRAIDVRKSEIAAMEWDIVLLPEYHDQKGPVLEDVRKRLIEFFAQPDPEEGLTFSDWVRTAEEEISVVDALSVYLRPTKSRSGGVLGSGLHSLQVIDGTTIKPLRNIRGGRPQPPAPAFQQYLYGAPRTDLMAPWHMDPLNDGENPVVRNFDGRQLIYKPFHRLSWTPYGFSETESCLNEIKLWVEREKWHQAYFDQSDLPAMFLPAPPEWGPQEIDTYQRRINNQLAGDPGWRWRIKVIPTGGGPIKEVREHKYDLGFDEHLLRIIAMAYSITPETMNLSPKSGLGGGGWAEESTRRQLRIAIRPRLIYLAEIFNFVIHRIIGERRFAFRWLSLSQQDMLQKAQIDILYANNGVRPRNEIREENGWDRSEEPEANQLLVVTRTGVVTLASATGAPAAPTVPPKPLHEGDQGTPQTGASQASQTVNAEEEIEDDDYDIGSASGSEVQQDIYADPEAQGRQRTRQKAMLKELGHLGAHLMKHVDRPFYPVTLSDEVVDAIGNLWLSRPPDVDDRAWANKIIGDAAAALGIE